SKLLICCLLIFSIFTAEAQNVETKIQSVTVYRKGAMVERTGKIDLKKGSNTLYLNNLSTELDPNTLRIGINNKSAKILSVKHEIVVVNNDLAQAKNTAADKRIALLKDSLTYYNAQLSVLNQEEELITTNRNIGGQQNGVSPAALKAMTDFYKKELTEIETKRIIINKKIQNSKNETLRLLQEKHNRQKNLQRKDSRVKLIIESDNALSSVPVSLSYIIFSASWEPFYEVRVDKTDRPLDLVYGAHIRQSSTEDWNAVNLTVSTGDPSIGNAAPDFDPMYLPPVRKSSNNKPWTPPTSNLVYGIVTDKNTKEPLVGVTVIETGTSNGTITDIDGKFQLEMQNTRNTLTFSYIGYFTIDVKPSEDMQVSLEEDRASLDEVVVIGYGTQRKSDIVSEIVSIDPSPREVKYNEPEKNIPLELTDTQTSTEFKIDLPYTIPSDDKVYDVLMLTYHIDANYRCISFPRQSTDAYLLADLTNFSQYPILKGSAYVYLDNAYQGECEIAPDFAADTLSITVGRDKNIAINRQAVKEFTSKKFIGSTIRVTKCYEITIKNNKRAAVNVEVVDQYPLPKYSDIKVELTDNGGAQVDAEKGKLTWMLKLDPQEKKVLRFSYEVKYPKSYNFAVE
ncbi:MAG: mucoidy inhibitor MuiA family protein, partial [Bacteroidales bacterium]|nr:mucoidy inhibitor MuiA family protein [Bacteroidales bacterium]